MMRARASFFLGGPISAALLLLAMDPYRQPVIAWFALVPLLWSLSQHRHRPGMRFLHGASLALIVAVSRLSWFTGEGVQGILAWAIISFFGGLFALAAGPLLVSPRRIVIVAGLPLLWTGLEVLRGPLSIVPVPLATNWCSIAQTLPAGSPASQVACIIGVHGLGLLMILSSTLFYLALTGDRLRQQLFFALAGCIVPLVLRRHGEMRLALPQAAGDLRVVVVAGSGAPPQRFLELARSHAKSLPAMVVGPFLSTSVEPDRVDKPVDRTIQPLAHELGSVVVAGAWTSTGTVENSPRQAAMVFSPSVQEPVWVLPGESGWNFLLHKPAVERASVFHAGGGRFGLGVGPDFDSPWVARRLVSQGAGFLVSEAGGPREKSDKAGFLHEELQAYRAIENQRWLVRSGDGGGSIVDPAGRRALRLQGEVHGSEEGTIHVLKENSIYTTTGWWIEPIAALVAGWILVWGFLRRLARRSNSSANSTSSNSTSPEAGPSPSEVIGT